jgi:hypothetical protein
MNTLTQNPFQIIKKRNFNDLFSIGFRYAIRYRKSIFLPIILIATPLQVAGTYLYLNTLGNIGTGNIMTTSVQSSFESTAINFLLFMLCSLLAGSFLLSVIFYHLNTYAGYEIREQEEEYTDIIRKSSGNLLKVLGVLIVSFIVALIFAFPLWLILVLAIMSASASGGFLSVLLILLLFFIFFILGMPVLIYFFISLPFAWIQANHEKDSSTSVFSIALSLIKGLRKNFIPTWGFSVLMLLIFMTLQSLVYIPYMVFLTAGLFGPVSESIESRFVTLLTLTFTSILQSVLSPVFIICMLYLYGHNKDLISGISLEKEIESL